MKLNKVATFSPGQEFRLDRKVIFVEYESMTGELVKCRFDLSQKTEMLLNDHRILSFDDLTYLCSKGEELFIKKVLYYEQECHMVIGDKLLITTKVYFENTGYQQAYETNNKLLRHIANSAYGVASRDWGDVLADSARYIYMQRLFATMTRLKPSMTGRRQPLRHVLRNSLALTQLALITLTALSRQLMKRSSRGMTEILIRRKTNGKHGICTPASRVVQELHLLCVSYRTK